MQVDYWKFLDELDTDEVNRRIEAKDTLGMIDEDTSVLVSGANELSPYYPDYPAQSAIGSEFYKLGVSKKAQTDCSADDVEHPAHYTRGRQEAIDTIEDAVIDAPDAVVGGLQWNALKYILRLWVKDTPKKNAQKARWYLDRLISKL